MAKKGILRVKILGDAGDLNKALGGATKSLVGWAAAAVSIHKASDFLGDTISAASDLNETTQKSSVVFGDLAGQIEAFGETAAEAMGQSKQQAMEAASTFGNLFVSMGLAQHQAADMSMDIVQLASDLASFNNVPVDDALTALRSGLVGEIEPLRRFGVNLNEATLKAKALEMGLYSGTGTLDAAAKAQAAYKIILEQTGTAQGDFARTADGLANQQKTLAAGWEDLKAGLGEKLMPIAQEFVGFLTEHLPEIADAFSALVDTVAWLGETIGDVWRGSADFIHWLDGRGERACSELAQEIQGELVPAFAAFVAQQYDAAVAAQDWELQHAHLAGTIKKVGEAAGETAPDVATYADTIASAYQTIAGGADDAVTSIDEWITSAQNQKKAWQEYAANAAILMQTYRGELSSEAMQLALADPELTQWLVGGHPDEVDMAFRELEWQVQDHQGSLNRFLESTYSEAGEEAGRALADEAFLEWSRTTAGKDYVRELERQLDGVKLTVDVVAQIQSFENKTGVDINAGNIEWFNYYQNPPSIGPYGGQYGGNIVITSTRDLTTENRQIAALRGY